ncbi:MAG: DJ-1/PfpI family protein [Candidatus Hodarchaeota archaeon]
MASSSYKSLLLLLALVLGSTAIGFSALVETQATVDALILVTDGFGWTFFDAVDYLESWGVNVDVIAHSLDVTIDSCPNHPPRPITADLLLTTFDVNDLTGYDCLFIPSGGHWQALVNSQAVRDFVSTAFTEGLVIASVCIGNMVVARSNEIVDGCTVVSYAQSNVAMEQAGASIVSGVEVVVDHHIVTGATGGGFPDGYQYAPTYEVCLAMVKAALGLSYVRSTTMEPLPDGTGFAVTVETQDPAAYLIGIPSNEIASLTIGLYLTQTPTEAVTTLQLYDPDYDGIYLGTVTGLAPGQYQLNVEVEDSSETLEIVVNAATSSLAPFLNPFLIGGVIVIGGIITSVLAIVLWKRRSKKPL